MIAGSQGGTALVTPSSILLSIVMLTLHPRDDTRPIGTLVHKGLIKVVDIPGPSTRVKLILRNRTLKSPDPVLIAVVVDALNMADG